MRFLVVDDSPTMRRIVINGLKVFGYTNTIEAGDGQEALIMLKQNEVDFILTDYNMPNMNGLELTKSVRSNEKYKHIPIIMITTRGAKNDIIECSSLNPKLHISFI